MVLVFSFCPLVGPYLSVLALSSRFDGHCDQVVTAPGFAAFSTRSVESF